MRGYKSIDFNQFHLICNKWKYDCEAIKVCHDWTNPKEGCLCAASMCHQWRKLGRADIKVSKITANNKASQARKASAHRANLCPANPLHAIAK